MEGKGRGIHAFVTERDEVLKTMGFLPDDQTDRVSLRVGDPILVGLERDILSQRPSPLSPLRSTSATGIFDISVSLIPY